MNSLIKQLRHDGFDYIDGTIRSQVIGEIWKKDNNSVEIYGKFDDVFKSGVDLQPQIDDELDIYSKREMKFKPNIGISLLKGIFDSIGLSKLDFSTDFNISIEKTKTVGFNFKNIRKLEYLGNDLDNYFFNADLKGVNQNFISNLEKKDFVIITGVLEAKDIEIEINTTMNVELNASIPVKMFKIETEESKADDSKIVKIKYSGDRYFPFALKYHKIIWKDEEYDRLKLISARRNFF